MDVHAGIRERPRDVGHSARLVVNLGDDRLAFDVPIAAVVEDSPGRVVVGRRHDHVAAITQAAAADCAQVDAIRGQRLGKDRHRAGRVPELYDELVAHPANRTRGAARPIARYDPLVPIDEREHTLLISATEADLPSPVAAALRAPSKGLPGVVRDGGIPWATASWGDPTDPPLLLIHGVTSAAGIFWRVAPALAAGGRRVLTIDLPGHGDTGTWRGRHQFADTADDLAGFIHAAGLDVPDLAVLGHSWGGMVVAGLPRAGVIPRTLILLDPPALAREALEYMTRDPTEGSYDSLDEARSAVRAGNPSWSDGDIEAKAVGLTKFDVDGALAILLDNGEWDAGLTALAHPRAAEIPIWYIRGEHRTGGLIPETFVPALAARVGPDHVLTIAGGPHSPMRTHPEATVLAILRAVRGG